MNRPPDKILGLGKLRKFSKGTSVFRAGDASSGFFFIRSGGIRVFQLDEQGRELDVARLGPGEFLGEAIAFVSERFPFFAEAVKDSEIVFFDRRTVHQAVDADPATARFFIELLARKCVHLSSRVESLGLRTVRQRLVQYLLNDCSGGSRCLVELPLKKSELAKHLGTVSETLSRTLKQMAEEGLIEVRGKTIAIRNCPALRAELKS
jgi:CRP/FNR family transcriptional regulator